MSEVTSYREIAVGGTDTAAPLNLATRLDLLASLVSLEGRRVLDCGCGAGGYVRALLERGVDAHGIEYSEEKVAEYRARGGDPERVRRGDLAAMAYADGAFDVAILNEVLEHVPDEARALGEIHRVLQPDGALIVFSPNRLYPFETHGATLRVTQTPLSPARTLFVPYLPVRVATAILDLPARNYWPFELRRILRDAKFVVEDTRYLWQTFENISGKQPAWIAPLVPALRRAAQLLQQTPVVRAFGVSQVVLARAI